MSEKTTPMYASQAADTLSSERRVSIWSVPVDLGPWFYVLLVSHTAPLVFLLWWTDATPKTHDNIANIIVNVTSGTAPLIFVAAVTTIIELEVLVVLREWYRDRAAKKRREAYKKGFEAGRKAEREAQATSPSGSANRNGTDK